MVAINRFNNVFRRPDWRPRAFRKPPPHVTARLATIDGAIGLACTRVFSPNEIARGDLLHLGVTWEQQNLQIASEIVVLSAQLGRHSRWNREGRIVVRTDLPKVHNTISWDGMAFGKYPTTFHRTDDFYQRERWYGHRHALRVRLLREETLDGARLLVVSVELVGALARNHPHFDRELLFRVNLLQEAIGGTTVLPESYTEEDLLAITFVNWKLLPPDLRSTDVLRVIGNARSVQEKLALIERLEFIKEKCPEAQIMAGDGGFDGYFLAKINEDCVVAEHLIPGNAIYIFDRNWTQLTHLSRRRLVTEQPDGFRRVEHRGDWRGTIAAVIGSARNLK